MRTVRLPSYELLHKLFVVNNGELFRKKKVSNNTNVGDKVGTLTSTGYKQVKVNRIAHACHHIIYKMIYNKEVILLDHIDGNRANNKIENLREATVSQNSINSKKKNNISDCKNVVWQKSRNNYIVKLHLHGKQKYFGEFKDVELADLVAQEARNKYFGSFARHS